MRPLNPSFLLLLMLTASTAMSQERKKVTEESGTKGSGTSEVYYVLKSDPGIKDGPYQVMFRDKLILSGFYDHGQKDSLWEAYTNLQSFHILISKKWYAQGKMTGKWEMFNQQGKPEHSYDFSTGALIYPEGHKADTSTFIYQTATGDWSRARLDKNPVPLYSSGEWLSYLNRSFRYPDDAVNNEIQGAVVISMTVDEEGHATNYTVFKSAAPVLDKEALQVISEFQHLFVPAEKDGKKVKVLFLQTLMFKLEKG
jgi:TonB family protein